MSRNCHFTLAEAYEAITKVKSDFNRQKLLEIHHMAEWFIPMYQDKPISVLTSHHFAQHYLPILRKIISQSAGKKYLLSYQANPWIGITKSIQWVIWLPTRVGTRAALTLLKAYVVELEKQAIVPMPRIMCSVQVQTDPISPALPQPVNDEKKGDQSIHDMNDTGMTSGIGCNTCNDDFSSSDDEYAKIAAAAQNVSKLSISSEKSENPRSPTVTTPIALSTPAGPRKLTKGSRKGTLKDSGINFNTTNALEESRKPSISERQSEDIAATIDATMTDEEWDTLMQHDDEVFEAIDYDDIPDLE